MNSSTTECASVELIPGMDKLLEYMKNQDKKIKELEKEVTRHRLMAGHLDEENKKLKEDNEEILNIIESHEHANTNLGKENKELKEDITNHPDFEEIATDWYERHNWMVDKDEFTELQEENKELKKHLECEEDGYPISNWFREKLNLHIKYQFTDEGGEYYEQLKDLKEKPNCLDDLIFDSLERIKEENKKLQEKVQEGVSVCEGAKQSMEEMFEEIIKLKEESEEMEYCNGVCCERSPKHGMSWWKSYGFNSPCKCAYTIKRQEENKKLEEENKKLKEVITKNYQKQINMTLMGVEAATNQEQ